MQTEKRRRDQRVRVLKNAKIILNHRSSVIDGTVRNLTTSGACLHISTSLGIPDTFELTLEGAQTGRRCQVVWRTDKKVGVKFVEPG